MSIRLNETRDYCISIFQLWQLRLKVKKLSRVSLLSIHPYPPYTHTHIHARTHARTHTHTLGLIDLNTHTHTHTHTHKTHTHTQTHAHTHTRTQRVVRRENSTAMKNNQYSFWLGQSRGVLQ